MSTTFAFTHEFRASSPAVVFRAYFDEALNAEEDRRIEVVKREVLSREDDGAVLRRRSRCVPKRQLPSFLRREGSELHYVEELVWTRADDRIDLDIRPSLFSGRIHIVTTYQLTPRGPGRIERSFTGTIDVSLPVIGRRVEKMILSDFEESLGTTAKCTQEWLDAHDVDAGVAQTSK